VVFTSLDQNDLSVIADYVIFINHSSLSRFAKFSFCSIFRIFTFLVYCLRILLQILEATEDDFNVTSVFVDYDNCHQLLELNLFSSRGIVRLEFPSDIAKYIDKVSYSVATSIEGNYFCFYIKNNVIIFMITF